MGKLPGTTRFLDTGDYIIAADTESSELERSLREASAVEGIAVVWQATQRPLNIDAGECGYVPRSFRRLDVGDCHVCRTGKIGTSRGCVHHRAP